MSHHRLQIFSNGLTIAAIQTVILVTAKQRFIEIGSKIPVTHKI